MSNRQADGLRLGVLGHADAHRTYLALKPIRIKPRHRTKLAEGSVLEHLDPLQLRIVRDGHVLARARLGRVGEREAIHVVSTDPEPYIPDPAPRHPVLEVRLRIVGEGEHYGVGEVIEYDRPLSREMLVLIDGKPVAVAEIVECDHEPVVRITRMLDG